MMSAIRQNNFFNILSDHKDTRAQRGLGAARPAVAQNLRDAEVFFHWELGPDQSSMNGLRLYARGPFGFGLRRRWLSGFAPPGRPGAPPGRPRPRLRPPAGFAEGSGISVHARPDATGIRIFIIF